VLYHRPALLTFVALTACVLGCDPPAGKNPGGTTATHDQAARSAAPDLAAPSPVKNEPETPTADTGAGAVKTPALYVRSSRCGECHENMRTDWHGSAHSRASHSPAYRKSLAAAPPAVRSQCVACHLPSFAAGQPDDEDGRPSEGVSCDGCHTLSAVQVQKTAAVMTFDPSSGKKYGPILGASGHYFHDMAYSPLHTRSEICAGCHHLTAWKGAAGPTAIPVVNDYADWQRLGSKKACQDCHMPSRGNEPVARGSKPRPNVPSHTFPGEVALGKSIRFELAPHGKPGEVAVEIQHSAGHMLPSGFVDRRLIVRAEWHGDSGAKLGSEDRVYGILLENDAGQPAPFFTATRIKQDHRMAPGKRYIEAFPVPNPTSGPAPAKLTLSLLAAPTAPELSAVYGEPELAVIKTISVNLPLRSGGK
jgi:hypothetical protein